MAGKKVNTGISGLDRLLGGGFEENTINLVSGKIGTGKSIFCLQSVYDAARRGEKSFYITTDENVDILKRQAKTFGWNLESLEKKNRLKMMQIQPFDIQLLSDKITSITETSKNIERMVIDSVSMFEMYIEKPFDIRKSLFQILNKLREKCRVTLITAEIPEDSLGLSRFGIVEFMVDCVIVLNYETLAKQKRSLLVRKMRTSKHSENIHPFELTKKGISIVK